MSPILVVMLVLMGAGLATTIVLFRKTTATAAASPAASGATPADTKQDAVDFYWRPG